MATLTLTTNNTTNEIKGSVTGAGSYSANTEATIKAIPSTNYSFLYWIDEEGRIVSAMAEYTFTITADITLQAVFLSNIDTLEVWGFCDANCKHRVLTVPQAAHLFQEMFANGGQVPTGYIPRTAVNEIIDQNTGKPLKVWIGTQEQYDKWSGDKGSTFAIITDDKSLEYIEAELLEHNKGIVNILDGTTPIHIKDQNGASQQLSMSTGVLKVGEEIISKKKLLWQRQDGENVGTVTFDEDFQTNTKLLIELDTSLDVENAGHLGYFGGMQTLTVVSFNRTPYLYNMDVAEAILKTSSSGANGLSIWEVKVRVLAGLREVSASFENLICEIYSTDGTYKSRQKLELTSSQKPSIVKIYQIIE